jgi:hypothetical protein
MYCMTQDEAYAARFMSKGSAVAHLESAMTCLVRLPGTSRNPRIATGNAKILSKTQYVPKFVGLLRIPDDIHAKDGADGSWQRVRRLKMLSLPTGEYWYGHDK